MTVFTYVLAQVRARVAAGEDLKAAAPERTPIGISMHATIDERTELMPPRRVTEPFRRPIRTWGGRAS